MKLRILFAALCLCLLLASPAAAAGGSGTAASPYIIETAAELQSIQNNLAAYYQLANDIDLSSVTWTPIGSAATPFSGQLDGNGYTISNLVLSSTTENTGLFRALTSGATIKNINLNNFNVQSTAAYCACLVGRITSYGESETTTLQNINMVDCSAITNSNYLGILLGITMTLCNVDITGCTFKSCTVESTEGYSVGIISGGFADRSNVNINECIVTASHAKAGLHSCGIITGALVSGSQSVMNDCVVNTCMVESLGDKSGGICGRLYTSSLSIANCAVENSIIISVNYAGGLNGIVESNGFSASSCTISNNTIVATGNYAGGVSGRVQSGATGVFNSCTVTDSTILASSYAATICPAFS